MIFNLAQITVCGNVLINLLVRLTAELERPLANCFISQLWEKEAGCPCAPTHWRAVLTAAAHPAALLPGRGLRLLVWELEGGIQAPEAFLQGVVLVILHQLLREKRMKVMVKKARPVLKRIHSSPSHIRE